MAAAARKEKASKAVFFSRPYAREKCRPDETSPQRYAVISLVGSRGKALMRIMNFLNGRDQHCIAHEGVRAREYFEAVLQEVALAAPDE